VPRNFPKPLYATGFHGGRWVEALGDCVVDERLSLLLKEFDQPLLLGNQPVNLRSFAFQEVPNAGLLVHRGKYAVHEEQILDREPSKSCSLDESIDLGNHETGLK
jgi:hypothetical protein